MVPTITVTESAVNKVSKLLADEGNPNLKLRIFVEGGGCTGFQYGFTFEENQNDDDFVITQNEVTVLVNTMSYQYMVGSEIDYTESLMGSQFQIRNPNATTQCGCGSSFAV